MNTVISYCVQGAAECPVEYMLIFCLISDVSINAVGYALTYFYLLLNTRAFYLWGWAEQTNFGKSDSL